MEKLGSIPRTPTYAHTFDLGATPESGMAGRATVRRRTPRPRKRKKNLPPDEPGF